MTSMTAISPLTIMMDKLNMIGDYAYLPSFDDDPTPQQLLVLAVAMAFFWAGTFYVLTGIIRYCIRNEPEWLIAAAGE